MNGCAEPDKADDKLDYKDIPLKELYELGDIACRHYKGLTRAGYNTLEETSKMSADEICRVKNIGRKCIYPLLVLMKEKGICDYLNTLNE